MRGIVCALHKSPHAPPYGVIFREAISYPTMHYLRDLWNRYYIYILALLAFLAVFIWGVNVGRHFSADGAESASITLGTTTAHSKQTFRSPLLVNILLKLARPQNWILS